MATGIIRHNGLIVPGDKSFYPAFQKTALQQNVAPAFLTFNADIGTDPDYPPLIATAGMLFLEANDITQPYLHNHSFSRSETGRRHLNPQMTCHTTSVQKWMPTAARKPYLRK